MLDSVLIDNFNKISLEDMGKVRLMNRVDTKYVTSLDIISELLKRAVSEYMVQEIDGKVNMPYYTMYYDTPDVNMFYEHQRGKKNRQKIRIREYEGSETSPFVEIKTKNNKGRTHKKRIKMEDGLDIALYNQFLKKHSWYKPESLIPQIENHFYRITLVNKGMTERITIDSNLEFHNILTDQKVSLQNIGIIEWKRDGRNCKSPFEDILRDLRIHPSGFSKYCMGMAITDPNLRQNRLKRRIVRLKRLKTFD